MLDLSGIKFEMEKSRPDSFQRAKAGVMLGVRFGSELDSYLDTYGRLYNLNAKLLGMTGHEGLESDLVQVTREVRSKAPWLENWIAIQELTPMSVYAVCDRDDRVKIAYLSLGILEDACLDFDAYAMHALSGRPLPPRCVSSKPGVDLTAVKRGRL